MSSAVSARPPGGLPREPKLTAVKDQQKARALGLTSATGLVIGTVIGAGVFTMPAVLAGAGTISLVVLAVIAGGAITAEVSRAPANDGLFPRPFAWTDRKDTAWFGVVVAAALPSLLMLWRYTTSSGLTVFTYLVTFAAGYLAVYQAMVVVLAGIILYAFIRARRERLGQVPAPADLPATAAGGENPEGRS